MRTASPADSIVYGVERDFSIFDYVIRVLTVGFYGLLARQTLNLLPQISRNEKIELIFQAVNQWQHIWNQTTRLQPQQHPKRPHASQTKSPRNLSTIILIDQELCLELES